MSFEPAGFAREINRAPRQGKQPCFAFTRACCPPESWLLLADVRSETKRERGGGRRRRRGRVSTTTIALQQCGRATRCTEIPIGCQIAIRLVGHCTTTDYRARIEPGSNKKCLRFSDISTFAWRARSRKISLFVAVDQTTERFAANCFAAFRSESPKALPFIAAFPRIFLTRASFAVSPLMSDKVGTDE